MFRRISSIGVSARCSRLNLLIRAMSTAPLPNVNVYSRSELPDVIVKDKILKPYQHLEGICGKNTRTRLIEAFNHWLQVPQDELNVIQQIAGMFHNHLMILDDVEDDTILRRGKPVAHSIYGVGSTLNATNYVIYLALKKCMDLHPEAARICVEEMSDMHQGMGTELYWRDTAKCPTEEEFIKMTMTKNISMVNVPFRLMELFTNNKSDFTKFISMYSLYIQIKDDYTDFCANDKLEYKYLCEDIAEGKFSFPIVHALNNECDEKVLYLLRKRPREAELKKYAIQLLEELGSFEYTLRAVESLDQKLREEIAILGENPKFVKLLDEYTYLFK